MRSRHILQTFGANLLMQVLGILTGVITARLLGPAQRGELNAIMLYPLLLTNAGQLGLDQAVALAICKDRTRAQIVAMSALVVSATLGMTLLAASYFAMPMLLGHEYVDSVGSARLYAWVIPAGVVAMTLLGVDWGKSSYKAYNALRSLVPLVYFAIVIALWLSHRVTVFNFVVASMFSVFLSLILRVGMLGTSVFRVRPDLSVCKELLKVGSGFYMATLAGNIAMRVDQMSITHLLSKKDMGLYVVATTIAGGVMIAAGAFSTVGFTNAADKPDPKTAAPVVSSQFRTGMMVNLICAAGLVLLSYPLIRVAFGAAFMGAVLPTCILIFATFFMGLSKILQESYKALGRWQLAMQSEIITIALIAVLANAFTSKMGLTGISLAVAIARICSLSYLAYHARAFFHMPLSHLWGINNVTAQHLLSRIIPALRSR